MAPPFTGAVVPAIKREADDSGDDAEINAARDGGARSTTFQSSAIDAVPPLFILTTEQTNVTRFPEGCPVLYGFASEGAEVRVREGIVRKVEMRADQRLEHRIEPRSEVALHRRGDGGGKGGPTLDRATEDQMAYAIRCPVLVAGEDGISEREAGEVLFAKRVTEHGRVGMKYIVQYAAAKDDCTLRIREGLTAEQLSYNLRCAANKEVGGSGGDGGGGEVAKKGEEQTNLPPPTVLPLLHQNDAKGSMNADSSRYLEEPPKDQEGAVENPPLATSDRESFEPLGGGEKRGSVESVPTSIHVGAQVKAEDFSTVENERPDDVASHPAVEQNGLACHTKPQLQSVAGAEDGARGAPALPCDASSRDCAPAARAGGIADPAFTTDVPAPHRQIKAELPVTKQRTAATTSVYLQEGSVCTLCMEWKDWSHFSNKQSKSATPYCQECRVGKPSDTRQCADCKITKTRYCFSFNQFVKIYAQRRKSFCLDCVNSRKGKGKKRKRDHTLRMREGLTAEQLSYNLRCVASRPAVEQNGLACHSKPRLPSVARADDPKGRQPWETADRKWDFDGINSGKYDSHLHKFYYKERYSDEEWRNLHPMIRRKKFLKNHNSDGSFKPRKNDDGNGGNLGSGVKHGRTVAALEAEIAELRKQKEELDQ